MAHRKGPQCHTRGIVGYGNDAKDGVCFIGIAPGRDEVAKGTPFTGPSGQLLDSILEACGYPRDRVYTTNLLCWWNDSPNTSEIYECWPRLKAELEELQPKLIIPLGVIATDFLLGNIGGDTRVSPSQWGPAHGTFLEGEEYYGFTTRQGRTTWCSALRAYVMPTYHPAAVLRGGPYFIADIVRSLSKIPLVIEDFLPNGLESLYEFNVAETTADAQRVLNSLPKGGIGVSLDIETNYGRPDIDVFTEDLLCLSLTWEGYPGDRRGVTTVIPGPVAKKLDWGVTEGVRWIGQNFSFDCNGLRRWLDQHPDLKVHEDTMYQSYALDERPGGHALEVLGGEWCAAPYWKSALAKYDVIRTVERGDGRKVRKKFREVPLPVLYRYNAGDTTYTFRTHARQRPMVTEDGMDRVYTELLIPAANAFKDIQYRGLYIDQHRMSELIVDWCQLWLDQEDELQGMAREAGWPGILNLRSSPQMIRFLYDTLKLPPQFKKEKKKAHAEARLTADKDAMELLASEHPFCDKAVDWRHTEHMLGVAKGLLERIKFDGMLHATPFIHGTETGRLSYHDPNIQNIGQPWAVGENLARIREVFAPRNPETHFIAEADYKQIELWMAVTWSKDPQMLADLQSGDFHRMTAADIYYKQWDEVTKDERFFSKMVTFGRLYERGAKDLTRGKSSLRAPDGGKATVAQAEEFIRRWSNRYRGYITWAETLKQQAIDDGIIVTPWGRKRRYYLVMGEEAHHMLRSALNFCMQSTAHDYTLASLIQLQQELWRYNSYILIETHDALMLEVDKRYAKEVFELTTEIMQSVRPNMDWPQLQVDWKSGPNWGACKEECHDCKRMYPFVKNEEVKLSPTVSFTLCHECKMKRLNQKARELSLAA